MGITRLIGDLLQAFGGIPRSISQAKRVDDHTKSNNYMSHVHHDQITKVNASMENALITVFGMESNGRIKKEKVCRVVEKLGLISHSKEDKFGFDLPGEDHEVTIEKVLGEEIHCALDQNDQKRNELLYEAFKIFDEDGNGYIDALELKRVLQCLGLDDGWSMDEIERMLKVVDLNLDGKVDFDEFGFMMGVNCH